MIKTADVAIIGGGIVGLATAYQWIQKHPDKSVVLLEKEDKVAKHQTGHNSGVLHSGIYYKPGSLKATNCRAGKAAMEQFCAEQNIDYEICGKVIVATEDAETPSLERIFERGQANGVKCELISRDRLLELEPHVRGVKAIHVPEAGIVNYRQVCQRLSELVTESGGEVLTSAKVTDIRQWEGRLTIESTAGDVTVQHAFNCAGLHCDRITKLAGQTPKSKIIPFRGEYFELRPEAYHFCRNLIYPVPDPKFPFLGVHFTRMIDGSVECGPNAVLAFAREGYLKTDVNMRDLFESLTYGDFLRLAAKYWKIGAGEIWRSISKRAFVHALQKLVPEIHADHLKSAPAGVRAQAVAPNGSMVDDFQIIDSPRVIHVCNAPSPAATSSLNIDKTVVDRMSERFA